MEVTCHELADGGHLADVGLGDAIDRWRAGNGAFWLDVSAYSEAELSALLDDLQVTGLFRQRCLETGQATTVVTLHKVTFIEVPVFADIACTRRTQVAGLCLKNLLLTIHPEVLEQSDARYKSIDLLELESLSTTKVLTALLWQESAVTARASRGIRKELVQLADRMDREIDDVDAAELEQIRRKLLLTDAIAEEQAEAFELLAHAQSEGLDFSTLPGQLGLLTTSSGATNRLVDRMDGRAQNLSQRYQDHKQELLNRRLGVLTVLSAIFLPLTLLAGIWGMNFENMPELDDPYAYPMALGIMAFLAVGGAWLFYKGGWFD